MSDIGRAESTADRPEPGDQAGSPEPPRPVAGRLVGGLVLVVVGLALLMAAVHESLLFAVWEPAGGRIVYDADGYGYVAENQAVAIAAVAVIALVAGTVLLGVVLGQIGRRFDEAVGAQPRSYAESTVSFGPSRVSMPGADNGSELPNPTP